MKNADAFSSTVARRVGLSFPSRPAILIWRRNPLQHMHSACTMMPDACKRPSVVGCLLILSFQCHDVTAFQLPRVTVVARNTALRVLSPRQLQFWDDVEGMAMFDYSTELHRFRFHQLYPQLHFLLLRWIVRRGKIL